MRIPLVFCIALLALVACGAVDELMEEQEQAKDVAAELRDLIGPEPFVSFRWENRRLKEVSVVFMEVPESVYIEDIVDHAHEAIGRHFDRVPEQVLIIFASEGGLSHF